jgi:transcriptional regulator with XRE-family HTH domain
LQQNSGGDSAAHSEAAIRLRWVMRRFDLDQAGLAGQIGYSPKSVNHVTRGRRPISRNMAVRLGEVFDLSVRWLLTGAGDPFGESTTTTTTQPGTVPATAEKETLVRWRCSVCTAYLAPGDGYCPGCGRPLQWPGE